MTEGTLREFLAEGPEGMTSLIVTRTEGSVYGWYNICPHAGRALNFAPDRFLFDARGRLVCAAHGAVFTLPDGQCADGPCRGAALTPVDLYEDADGIWWKHSNAGICQPAGGGVE